MTFTKASYDASHPSSPSGTAFLSAQDAAEARRSPLFQHASQAQRQMAASRAVLARYCRGHVLAREGGTSPGLFVILRGAVRIDCGQGREDVVEGENRRQKGVEEGEAETFEGSVEGPNPVKATADSAALFSAESADGFVANREKLPIQQQQQQQQKQQEEGEEEATEALSINCSMDDEVTEAARAKASVSDSKSNCTFQSSGLSVSRKEGDYRRLAVGHCAPAVSEEQGQRITFLGPGDWFGHPPSESEPPVSLVTAVAESDTVDCALLAQPALALKQDQQLWPVPETQVTPPFLSPLIAPRTVLSTLLPHGVDSTVRSLAPLSIVPSPCYYNRLLAGKLEETLSLTPMPSSLDTFLGHTPLGMRFFPRIFGGQLVGQALVAACHTVGDQALLPHSLHSCFLRPGNPKAPVVYSVERIRDGTAFAARQVRALQHPPSGGQESKHTETEQNNRLKEFDLPGVHADNKIKQSVTHSAQFSVQSAQALRLGREVGAIPGSTLDAVYKEIFVLTVSFHRDEPGLSFSIRPSMNVPPPCSLPTVEEEEWRLRCDARLPSSVRRRLADRPVRPLPADIRYCTPLASHALKQIEMMGSQTGLARRHAAGPSLGASHGVPRSTNHADDDVASSGRDVGSVMLENVRESGFPLAGAREKEGGKARVKGSGEGTAQQRSVCRDLCWGAPAQRAATQFAAAQSTTGPSTEAYSTTAQSTEAHGKAAQSTTTQSDKNVQSGMHVWLRARGLSPDLASDQRMQRCLIAYMSDFVLLGASLLPHGLFPGQHAVSTASLDHSVWFHEPVSANEWLLYSVHTTWTGHARGFNHGKMFTGDGRLAASVAQEGLIRPKFSLNASRL